MPAMRVTCLPAIIAAVLLSGVTAAMSPPASDMRVVTYNIKHGRGNDDVVDLARTAAVLRSLTPDIIGLQEVDNRAERSGKVDEAEALGQALGMHHAFGRFMDAVIDKVEVKTLGELSPREIEHDNPEFRRLDETVDRHVGTVPWPEDGEVAQARGRHPEVGGVGATEVLGGELGDAIRAERACR